MGKGYKKRSDEDYTIPESSNTQYVPRYERKGEFEGYSTYSEYILDVDSGPAAPNYYDEW